MTPNVKAKILSDLCRQASKPSHPPPATEIWLSKGLNIHFPPMRDGRRGVERDAASRPTFDGLTCQTLPELPLSRHPSSPIDGLWEQELPQCPPSPVPSSSHGSCWHKGKQESRGKAQNYLFLQQGSISNSIRWSLLLARCHLPGRRKRLGKGSLNVAPGWDNTMDLSLWGDNSEQPRGEPVGSTRCMRLLWSHRIQLR